MRAIGKVGKMRSGKVRITKEKVASFLDPMRVYPLIGPAQQHHAHYKCTVYWEGQDEPELFYVDHNHLHVKETDTSPSPQPSSVVAWVPTASEQLTKELNEIELRRMAAEMNYWELKAEAAKKMAEAHSTSSDATGVSNEEDQLSLQRQADQEKLEAERILARADEMLAKSKVIELEKQVRQLKATQPPASESIRSPGGRP